MIVMGGVAVWAGVAVVLVGLRLCMRELTRPKGAHMRERSLL